MLISRNLNFVKYRKKGAVSKESFTQRNKGVYETTMYTPTNTLFTLSSLPSLCEIPSLLKQPLLLINCQLVAVVAEVEMAALVAHLFRHQYPHCW